MDQPVSRIAPQCGTHGLAPKRGSCSCRSISGRQEKFTASPPTITILRAEQRVRKVFLRLWKRVPTGKGALMRSPLVAVVLSLMASIAAAEEEYFLKIEVVGYDQQKQ